MLSQYAMRSHRFPIIGIVPSRFENHLRRRDQLYGQFRPDHDEPDDRRGAPQPPPEKNKTPARLYAEAAERKERLGLVDPRERMLTAVHEAGHAHIGGLLGIKIAEVSIIPDGETLGRTNAASEAAVSKHDLLIYSLAGPVAEWQYLHGTNCNRPESLASASGDMAGIAKIMGCTLAEAVRRPMYRAALDETNRLVRDAMPQIKIAAAGLTFYGSYRYTS